MNNYLSYLTSMVSFEESEAARNDGFVDVFSYSKLIDLLFRIDYIWLIHNDDNRIYDGKELRNTYYEDGGCDEDEYMELSLIPCSVLEVLISLAIRMDNFVRDPECDHVNRWFWEMVFNLDLRDCTDENFDENRVKNAIFVWLNREYDECGHGGIFPRNVTLLNQRDVELADQMAGYINEWYF